jgi:hypothetical protein
MPPEVCEGIMRMEMTTISKINKFEDECEFFFKESVKVWEELMGDLEMKVVEAKLREVQEHANEAVAKETTFTRVERLASILSQ